MGNLRFEINQKGKKNSNFEADIKTNPPLQIFSGNF